MSGKTAGQQAYEGFVAFQGDDDVQFETWEEKDENGDRHVMGRADWEAAGAAVETGQVRLAREDRDQLRKRVLDLAAKWDATAARNQRNGQSLIDQGDEYGNEGLVAADALGACVVDLRAVLADAPGPKPAPELAAAMAEARELRKVIAEMLGMFRAISGGWGARTSSSRLRKLATRAEVTWDEYGRRDAPDTDEAAETKRLRELLDEIGVMAANAPEDGDSFGVLETIAMRIAAADVPIERAGLPS